MAVFNFSVIYAMDTHQFLTPTIYISSNDAAVSKKIYTNLAYFGFIFNDILEYNDTENKIIIHPATDKERPGALCNIDKLVAINFIYPELREIFLMHFPQLKKIGTALQQDTAGSYFYFGQYTGTPTNASYFFTSQKKFALSFHTVHLPGISINNCLFLSNAELFLTIDETITSVKNTTPQIAHQFKQALNHLIASSLPSIQMNTSNSLQV